MEGWPPQADGVGHTRTSAAGRLVGPYTQGRRRRMGWAIHTRPPQADWGWPIHARPPQADGVGLTHKAATGGCRRSYTQASSRRQNYAYSPSHVTQTWCFLFPQNDFISAFSIYSTLRKLHRVRLRLVIFGIHIIR